MINPDAVYGMTYSGFAVPLASKAGSFITGQAIVADGGVTIV